MTRPNKYPYTKNQWIEIKDCIYTYGGEKVATIRRKVNIFTKEVAEETDDKKENRAPIGYPP